MFPTVPVLNSIVPEIFFTKPTAMKEDRPNIVIFYADQHRADAVGWDHPSIPTPNLNRLAEAGMLFEQSFCQYPVCTPSRMSLLTGQYVHTHGVPRNNAGLPPGAPTFAHALRAAGYSTACIGKMHFYPTYAAYGFDHMELAEQDGPGRFEDDYHRFLAARGRLDLHDLIDQRHEFRSFAPSEYWQTFGARPSDLPEELHSTTWIGERACAWLRNAEPPFCAWVGFIKPHHPFDPPASWLERMPAASELPLLPGWTEAIPAQDAGKPGYFDFSTLDEATLRHVMRHYYATIAHMDAWIGRAIEVLEQRGLGNTIIVYTADHGELLGYHHLLLKGGYLYEPLVRAPLVISELEGTRGWLRGSRTDALVESVDVTATILEAAGASPLPRSHGRTLTPLLRGEALEHRAAVFAQNRGQDMLMLRTREWKLIESSHPRDRMLFHLEDDPLELNNLIDEPAAAEVAADLRTRLLRRLAGDMRPQPYRLDDAYYRRASLEYYIQAAENRLRTDPLFRGLTPYAQMAADALQQLANDAG